MNKKNISIISSLIIFFCFQYSIASADVFSVNLFYNPQNKTLVFDKEAKENVSLNKEKEISAVENALKNTTGTYIIKLYDVTGNEFLQKEFNPQNGKFNYETPYFSIAKKLEILEKNTNKKILEADLSNFVTCNGNGICEFEKGENFNTCISDCASSNVKYSPETQKTLDENGGIIKDPKNGDVVLRGGYHLDNPATTEKQTETKGVSFWNIILIIIIGTAIGIATFFVLRRMRQSD